MSIQISSEYELRVDYTVWEMFWYAVGLILAPLVALPIIIWLNLKER